MRFLVSYDLRQPGQSYQTLIDALTRLGAVRVLLSAWFLTSNYTSVQLRDHLWQYMDANDRLLVVPFDDWAWNNLIARID